MVRNKREGTATFAPSSVSPGLVYLHSASPGIPKYLANGLKYSKSAQASNSSVPVNFFSTSGHGLLLPNDNASLQENNKYYANL